MKKYLAYEMGNCSEINQNLEKILTSEEFIVYIGQAVELDDDLGDVAVFYDDIGRGGGDIGEVGSIYGAVKYMAAFAIGSVTSGIFYDEFKRYFSVVANLFKKSKKIGSTLHFYVDTMENTQYHFVFFSFIDQGDFEKAWREIPTFIVKNSLPKNKSVDCYYDTKKCEWHIVGERDLSNVNVDKHKIYH